LVLSISFFILAVSVKSIPLEVYAAGFVDPDAQIHQVYEQGPIAFPDCFSEDARPRRWSGCIF